MPLDANCPRCRHVFPVTETRGAVGVSCPGCETELTAEFRRRSTPEPGQHPYELFVSLGRPAGAAAAGGPKKHRLPDDDESDMHRGGGMGIVVLAGVGALVLALAGLGATGYLLFTNLDTSDSAINKLNSNDEPKRGTRDAKAPATPIIPRPERPKGTLRPGRTTPSIPGKFDPVEFPVEMKPNDTFELKLVTGTRQEITPPPIDLKSPVTLKLPGPAEAVTVGGNGRYIIFHIPSTQQLAVFDASKGALVATEKVPEQFRLFLAGGQNRVVSCDLHSRILRSYTLPELRKEFEFSSPLLHHPEGIAMGSGVNSPLLVTDPFANVALFDLTKDGATLVQGSKTDKSLGLPAQSPNPRAAPSGNVFLFSRVNNRGEATGILTVEGSQWKAHSVDLTTASASADSRYLLGFGRIIDVGSRRPIGNWMGNDGSAVWYVGGTSGRSFLRLAQTQQNSKSEVVVSAHLAPQTVERDKLSVMIGVLPEMEGLIDWSQGVAVPLDKHLFLIPDAKLLVVLPLTKDRLILRKVDAR